MNTRPAIALTLLVVTAIGFATPFVAAADDCTPDADADCCEIGCALCLCCSGGPRTILGELAGRSAAAPDGGLCPDEHATLPEPLPREILHVPRPAPVG